MKFKSRVTNYRHIIAFITLRNAQTMYLKTATGVYVTFSTFFSKNIRKFCVWTFENECSDHPFLSISYNLLDNSLSGCSISYHHYKLKIVVHFLRIDLILTIRIILSCAVYYNITQNVHFAKFNILPTTCLMNI